MLLLYKITHFRLGLKYCEEVANPMEMIVFRKDKNIYKKSRSNFSNIDDNIDDMVEVFGSIDVNNNLIVVLQLQI